MSYATDLIERGLCPRRLEELLRGHASTAQIAEMYGTTDIMIQRLMERWTVGHLSGRAKSNVVLVRMGEGYGREGR